MAELPAYMTTEEVAAVIRQEPGTLRYWRHEGRGPRWIKLPGAKRALYPRADFEQWLEPAPSPHTHIRPVGLSGELRTTFRDAAH